MTRHRYVKPKPGQFEALLPARPARRNPMALAALLKHAGVHAKPWKALRRQQRQHLAATGHHDD